MNHNNSGKRAFTLRRIKNAVNGFAPAFVGNVFRSGGRRGKFEQQENAANKKGFHMVSFESCSSMYSAPSIGFWRYGGISRKPNCRYIATAVFMTGSTVFRRNFLY